MMASPAPPQSSVRKHQLFRSGWSLLNGFFSQFIDIWTEMGMSHEVESERIHTILRHFKVLCETMMAEETEVRDEKLRYIDETMSKITKLCKELNKDIYTPPDVSILEIEREVKVLYNVLLNEKEKKMEGFRQLLNEEEHLCIEMGEERYEIDNDKIPTASEQEDFQKHISALKQEKAQRQKVFKSTRAVIKQLVEELEHSPDSSFLDNIISGTSENFIISQKNMKQLKLMKEQLSEQVEKNEVEAADLRTKMGLLWERLQVDDVVRNQFSMENSGHQPSVIQRLREEVARLEELKLQNIGDFIMKVRQDIQDLWQKCYYTSTQRAVFLPFYSDDYSEELLEEHEKEFRDLQEYYNDRKDVFNLFENYINLFDQMEEFEFKKKDCGRLNNRGGALLKEEQQRRKITKEIPRLEEKITKKVQTYEDLGYPILVNGVGIHDFMQARWDEYEEKKEEEKQERTQARKNLVKKELMLGSIPAVNLRCQEQTMRQMGNKRKNLDGDTTQDSKRRKDNNATSRLQVPRVKVTKASRNGSMMATRKMTRATSRVRNNSTMINSALSVDTLPSEKSYNQFARGLSTRKNPHGFLSSTNNISISTGSWSNTGSSGSSTQLSVPKNFNFASLSARY